MLRGGFFDEANVSHSLRGEGFDASEDGTGRGTPIVPVSCREVAQTLTQNYGKQPDNSDTALGPNLIAFDCKAGANTGFAVGEVPGALRGEGHGGGHAAVAFSCKDHGADAGSEVAPTLRSMGHDGSHANGGGQLAVAIQAGATRENPESGPDGVGVRTDGAAYTLEARAEVQAVMSLAIRGRGDGRNLEAREDGTANAVLTPNGGRDGMGVGAIATHTAVRRLTPRECERLQGFPDDFTAIPWGKKTAEDCPDGPRYKALGNSMAVNAMRWIGERIQIMEGIDA